MPSRELNAWIRLIVILVVYIPYFAYVLELFRGAGPVGRPLCLAFVGAAIAHAAIAGVAQAAARIVHGVEQVDERDRAIEALSLRVAYVALISLVMTALGTIALIGAASEPSAVGTILLPGFSATSQFVFLCFVCAEALRHVVQLFCYRRGAWVAA
jgi:hypothetical protein